MKNTLIAILLLSPVIAQANVWEISCGGIKLTLTESKTLNVVDKGKQVYAFSGGVNHSDGSVINIFNKYLSDVKVDNNNVIPVDANDRVIISQRGNDDLTIFQTADERGVHNCSVDSFKAGE
jgi:hypothetical protein